MNKLEGQLTIVDWLEQIEIQARREKEAHRLVEENYGLAYYIVNRMCAQLDYHSREDACQRALIALYKAAKKYDPERGIKFSAFAGLFIRREIFKVYREEKANNRGDVSYDMLIEDGDSGSVFSSFNSYPLLEISEAEILDVLYSLAGTVNRVKQKKGILVFALELSGVAREEIIAQLEITPHLYSSVKSAGRAVLKNTFLEYIGCGVAC